MYNESDILHELQESGPEVMHEILEFNAREIIALVPVLADAPHRFQERVAVMLHPEYGFPNDIVFAEGEHAEFVYFVHSGLLDVIVNLDEADERVISTVGDGSYFGDMGMLLDHPHSASIKCRVQCVMYRASCDEFRKLLDDYPSVHQYMMDIAVKRSTMKYGDVDGENAKTALRRRASGSAGGSHPGGRRQSMQEAVMKEMSILANMRQMKQAKADAKGETQKKQGMDSADASQNPTQTQGVQMTDLDQ